MTAIAWLILIVGIGVIIEAWQGKSITHTFSFLFAPGTTTANTITKKA